MQGLAKTAATESSIEAPVHKTADMTLGSTVSGIPLEIYMFYNKQAGAEDGQSVSQLKTVFEYAKSMSKDGTSGDILTILNNLDRKLGTPKIGESRLGRAFNYAKLTGMINNLEKQRKAITGA